MAGYLGAIPVPQATQHRESFTATSGQTTFNTAGYTVGFLDVYLNGSHLSPADFTATNGSDVVLASGASADDVCDIISYTAFEVADQTFTGTTTLDGAVVINESSADVDFRVESNGDANMLFVDGGNNAVVIGHNNANDGSVSSAFSFQNIGTSYNSSSIGLARFSADVNAPAVAFHKSRNASIGGDTVVADNDELGRIRFFGNDGTDFAEGARITAIVNGTPGGGDMPTELVFSTSADGAESPTARMTIDSSGNVGIGTSPTQLLTVGNTSTQYTRMQFYAATNGASTIHFGDGTSGADNYQGYLNYAHDSNSLQFATSAAERMRLDSSGKLLVGLTSTLSAGTQGVQLDGASGIIDIGKESTNTRTHIAFFNPNGEVGKITTNGSATAYNTSSDYRLKTDAQPMTGASARVQALKPVNFEWISDGTRVDGFLAHEAQAVVPEAVTGTKDAMRDEEYEVTPAVLDADGNETKPAVMGTRSVPDLQGIDQSKMVPLLVAALQEALARITALENA
tara:strand:+ start:35 stop:1576 length:1542 start_codon:yes stop_codon:yes gene_type:complete